MEVNIPGIKLNTNATTVAVIKVIKIAPVAAPAATCNPFFLLFCTDSFTIKAIMRPGLKATLICRIRNSIVELLEITK